MNQVKKTLVVPYTAQQMFELVDNVLEYPKFLPWCSKTEVLMREGNELEAMLHMDYLKIRQEFGTHNTNIPGEKITMRLLKGPFKNLDGVWEFKDIGRLGCQVKFHLDYEFSSAILSKLIGPVFSVISNSLVDSFIKEAGKRYGNKK